MAWTKEQRAAMLAQLDAYEREVLDPAEKRQRLIDSAWDAVQIDETEALRRAYKALEPWLRSQS